MGKIATSPTGYPHITRDQNGVLRIDNSGYNFRGQIIVQLRRRNVELVTTNDDGTSETEDADLLDRATSLGRVLVTSDRHLLIEASRRQRANIPFAGVIYCHQRYQAAIGPCVDELELIAQASDPSELANKVWHLPL
jgi:hypothetical protein